MGVEQGKRGDGDSRLAAEAAVVLDPRLAEIWQFIWTHAADEPVRCVSLELLGGLLRLAYVQGYSDATADAVSAEPDLFQELGVRRPRPARLSVTRRRSGRLPGRGRAPSGSSDT